MSQTMSRWQLWILAAALLWLVGALSAATLMLEYPSHVSAIHWRTYPGLFQWPVFFFPACCLFLIKPAWLTWQFLADRAPNRRVAAAIVVGPIAVTVVLMSTYEWFSGKPAVWELAPSVSARAAARDVPARYQNDRLVMAVKSFDDLALSVRAKAPPTEFLPECRFSGTNIRAYRETECFCAPAAAAAMPVTGAQCDRVKQIWFGALTRAVQQPEQRSYTFYTTRLSFTAMALVFIAGFLTVIGMSCFDEEMAAGWPKDYLAARACIQMFAVLCCLWWLQRFYLGYEQSTIFPNNYAPIFLSREIGLLIGVIIAVGAVHAFGLKVKALKSFAENLMVPLLFLCSSALGIAQPDMMAALFRVTFGVDATGPALIAFITIVLFFCTIPGIYLLKDAGVLRQRTVPVTQTS